jgi:hypothetical protein
MSVPKLWVDPADTVWAAAEGRPAVAVKRPGLEDNRLINALRRYVEQ